MVPTMMVNCGVRNGFGRLTVGAFLCLLSTPLTVGVALAAPAMLPVEVEKSLEHNGAALSPVTVSWVQVLRPLVPATEAVTELRIVSPPPEVLFAPDAREMTIENDLLYSRTSPVAGKAGALRECGFDGTVLYAGNRNAGGGTGSARPTLAKLNVVRLANERPGATWIATEYFDAAGFMLAGGSMDLSHRRRPCSAIVRLLDDGGNIIQFGPVNDTEKPVVRVEIECADTAVERASAIDPAKAERQWRAAHVPEDQINEQLHSLSDSKSLPHSKHVAFFLDPAMGYAVLRIEERWQDGTLLKEVENKNFVELKGRGLWLPRSSHTSHFTWPTAGKRTFATPILAFDIDVKGIDTEPKPPSLFTLQYDTPGTLVVDRTQVGGQRVYEIPASPADLRSAIARSHGRGILALSGGTWRYGWYLVVLGAGMTVLACLLLCRGRRSSIQDDK